VGTFTTRGVATTLWVVCVIALLCVPGQESNGHKCLLHTVVHRLVTLGKSVWFNTDQLCQVHQYCSGLQRGAEASYAVDQRHMPLKETCRG
jgi:hypothetical protein